MDGRLNQDHLDLLRAFVDAEVRFLIVGAHVALAAFGAPLSDLTVTDLATRGTVFQMGLPPNRIDVLAEISGVDHAWLVDPLMRTLEIYRLARRRVLRRSSARSVALVDRSHYRGRGLKAAL